ncbi:MAG: DinB family protein [Vicinamibacterales bacterium]
MDHKAFFLKFWDKEATATREVIARVPQDRSDYRADPKARTAREIAWLMVHEETVLADGLEKSRLKWIEAPPPASMPEILDAYDRQHEAATTKLKALDAAKWESRVPFIWGGQEVMNETAYDMAWGFLLDQIHHRGQLSTYLRPMGAKVPQIYGPSADEP